LLAFVCLYMVLSACRPTSVGPIVLTQMPTLTAIPPTASQIATSTLAPTASRVLSPTILPTSPQVLSATITPTALRKPPPTMTSLAVAATLTSFHNADWTPEEQEIGGVVMVKVPAGRFKMGKTSEIDETYTNDQEMTTPYWIDKYEVTNAQFAAFEGTAAHASYWTDDNRPRETISWFEARDFCARRGARLPTEREWEYAARGPDNLDYTWGNQWTDENSAWRASDSETAVVGSHPTEASWVGAQDMAGNVGEWVSSEYKSYPYDAGDGREGSSPDVRRVVRGGWFDSYSSSAHVTVRRYDSPDKTYSYYGFRCARSL
jgi:formylglycine-generating enzyme required for sulfatase activity